MAVTKDGDFFIDKRQVSYDQLKSILSNQFSISKQLSVIVMPDEDSAIKWSIQVLDICKILGIENVSVAEEVRSK